jgi:hypothetical protein
MLKLALTVAVVSQHPVSNKALVLPVVEFFRKVIPVVGKKLLYPTIKVANDITCSMPQMISMSPVFWDVTHVTEEQQPQLQCCKNQKLAQEILLF